MISDISTLNSRVFGKFQSPIYDGCGTLEFPQFFNLIFLRNFDTLVAMVTMLVSIVLPDIFLRNFDTLVAMATMLVSLVLPNIERPVFKYLNGS